MDGIWRKRPTFSQPLFRKNAWHCRITRVSSPNTEVPISSRQRNTSVTLVANITAGIAFHCRTPRALSWFEARLSGNDDRSYQNREKVSLSMFFAHSNACEKIVSRNKIRLFGLNGIYTNNALFFGKINFAGEER